MGPTDSWRSTAGAHGHTVARSPVITDPEDGAMTSAATAEQGRMSGADEHVDVLVIGAGVSGIGAGHRLRTRFPERSFTILEAQGERGGTWWTHRYPGVRSDSDLFT